MKLVLIAILLLLATFIYFSKRLISNEKLERLANAVSVVSLVAALLVFVIPAATPEEPEPQQEVAPLSLALFDEYESEPPGIILSRIPERVDEVGAYSAGPISQPDGNTVSLVVTNEHSSSRVHLRNYIPIKLISYAPITDTYDVYMTAGSGAGFYIRTFVAQLSPTSPSPVKAEYIPEGHQIIDEVRDKPEFVYPQEGLPSLMSPDYFYLDPGESEVFVVEFIYLWAGHYTFQMGVEYLHNGRRSGSTKT